MKVKLVVLALLLSICVNGHTQNYNTFSGTIRFSGGFVGDALFAVFMILPRAIHEGLKQEGYADTFSGWLHANHLSFLRFSNNGFDILYPQWTMSFSNDDIKLEQTSTGRNYKLQLLFDNRCYINYLGYHLNWRDPFSRFGFSFGMDYELRKFNLWNKYYRDGQYHFWSIDNKIQSLVPSLGLRYRLISPGKEVDGFPVNMVLEVGISYAIAISFENDGYTDSHNVYCIDALNNGFRSLLGIAITTNKYGSLYLRWTKDLYNLYNNDYIANDNKGYLYNNKVTTNLSCLCIGWATFL